MEQEVPFRCNEATLKFVLSWLRSHMDPENAECILFIGSNWDVLPENLRPTAEDFLKAYEKEYGNVKAGTDCADDTPVAAAPATATAAVDLS